MTCCSKTSGVASTLVPGEALRTWESLAREHSFVDFLSPEDGFRTCVGTQARWARRSSPGIYFWIAEDGEAYVGQSIAPQNRLRQHMRDHGDLVHAAFLPCQRDELDRHEARLVDIVGKHLPLRNIKLAASTASDVPFDKLVSREEQAAFLDGAVLADIAWRDLNHLTQLQAHRFRRYLGRADALEGLGALQTFVSRALPKPAATEVRFWSATVRARDGFIRVNAGQQEVFTYELIDGQRFVRLLTAGPIEHDASFRMRYQTPSFVTGIPPGELEPWLTGRALLSCRALVIQLMRHTQALNSGSHCPQAVRWDSDAHQLLG